MSYAKTIDILYDVESCADEFTDKTYLEVTYQITGEGVEVISVELPDFLKTNVYALKHIESIPKEKIEKLVELEIDYVG